jgi:hypothetical protein
MFKTLNYQIPKHPYISKPIKDESVFQKMKIPEFFDRFGYELTYVESVYHKANGIDGHVLVPGSPTDAAACIQDWMIQVEEHENIYLDHCHVNTRYAYEGAALDQIKEWSIINPRLRKLINIKPKYMVDFCLDYITDSRVYELIHIEHDFHDYDLYMKHLSLMEELIHTTDWDMAYFDLQNYFHKQYNYDEYAQARYKAKYFGLDKLDYLHEPKMLSYKKVF